MVTDICSCCKEVWNRENLQSIRLGKHELYLCPDCIAEYNKIVKGQKKISKKSANVLTKPKKKVEMLTVNEETVYAFALRYASGRHTYAHGLVIDEIIKKLPQFPNPESFLREIGIRREDATSKYNEWDEIAGEEKEFANLERAIKDEIQRRN